MLSVAIYLVDRAFGGPEEGGWWYTHGTPVTENLSDEVGKDWALPRYFHNENEAVSYSEQLQDRLDDTVNKGRRSIGSVLSQGLYWAYVEEGHPRPFPEERPHYE
jgi:hypothetical protein